MKIRTRLILLFTLLAGFGFYRLTDWIAQDLRPQYAKTVEEALVDASHILAEILATDIKNGELDMARFRTAFARVTRRELNASIYEITKTHVDVRAYVTDANGRVIFDSTGMDVGKDYSGWRDVALTLKGQYGARTSHETRFHPTDSVMHVAAPVYGPQGLVGVVALAKPTTSLNAFLQAARPKIRIAGVIAGLSVIALALLVTLWVTAPIRKLTHYAKAVRDGKRAALPSLGKSELAELGRSFEEMTTALEGKKYIENYVQTLTHELKSPLAAIQGASELLNEDMPLADRRAFLAHIRNETERVRQLVDRMLELAALEGKKKLEQVRMISADELIETIRARFAPEFKARGLSFAVGAVENASFSADPFLAEQALLNVVQNAVEFSPEGGVIGLSARVQDASVQFIIEDEGPGIPDWALAKIFDRFYSLPRPATAQKSTGLGLSFVRQILELHNGRVILENRPHGGARAILEFSLHPNV